MSRRTKLIIAALFLVLLIIPAVYVVLTWAPAHPLEARLLPKSIRENSGLTNPFIIEIKNTSAVSFCPFGAEVHLPVRTHIIMVDVRRSALDHATGIGGMAPLRPGEVRDCDAMFVLGDGSTRALTGAVIEFKGISQTKWRAQQFSSWICEFLPDSFLKWVPSPELDHPTTPLQLP